MSNTEKKFVSGYRFLMLRVCRWVVILFFALGMAAGGPAQAQDGQGVSPARLQRLSRGVNLSRWFRFPNSHTPAFYAGHIKAQDVLLLRSLGLTHVRLAFHPQYLLKGGQPALKDNFYLEHLDKAIALLLKHDLAVVLDLHDENKTGPEKDPAYQKTLITLWGALAGHWKKTDPERVFFELLNEPAFLKNPQGWLPLQEKLAAVVRRQAPNHTIVATWPYFSAVSGFSQIQPLKDKNVVYTFHVYDPFFFTHQGAGWTPDATVAQLRSVPYPGEMPRCQGALGQAKTPWVKETLRSYCRFGWNAEKMKNHVGRAAAWGKKHGVPLWVGEFGVYPPHAPREDLLMWYRDARSAFEAHGLGWALWAYDEGFGLDRKMLPDGSFQIDEGVAGIIKE